MSAVPPGAPLDVDELATRIAHVLKHAVPRSPSVVPDALEDALALCAEVRRLRAALAEIANDALISYGEVGIRSGVGDSRLMRLRNAARAALEEVRARDAEIAWLRELFAEPHFMGAPAMAGGGFDESVVMVSRAWYTRLAALAPTGEPGPSGGDTDA